VIQVVGASGALRWQNQTFPRDTVLPKLGIDGKTFWNEVEEEWRREAADPMLTYMRLIRTMVTRRPARGFCRFIPSAKNSGCPEQHWKLHPVGAECLRLPSVV
jgi:hypothetical protein